MSNLLNRPGHKFILLFVDLIIIFVSYVAAFLLRYQEIPTRNWNSFLSLAPWILLIGLFFLVVYELYSVNRKSVWDLVTSLMVSVTFMMFLTMAASYLFRQFALPRTVIIIASILMVILMLIWKYVFKKIYYLEEIGRLLIVGDKNEIEKLVKHLKDPLLSVQQNITKLQLNESLDKIIETINKVDYVMVCSDVPEETKTKIIYHAVRKSKVVYIIPSFYDMLLSKSYITSLDDTMVMAVKPFGFSWDQLCIKRLFDITVSLIMLVLLFPVFFIVGLLIKLEKPRGAVFYSQKRIGLNNREFSIYKFRSMIEGAENYTGPTLAKENDNRVTRIGRFIRSTRIDELPQLFNVLKGDMSLVGPRPEREFFVRQFLQKHEAYQYRNTVRPGITGYAQIMGKYSTDVEDKLRYDLYYIRNYSLWLDFVILLRTFIVLLNKSTAEGKNDSVNIENEKLQNTPTT